MRDYGVVRVRFWSWAKRKKLSLEARDLALYLLTSPHGNSLGCFRLPMAYLCDDLDTNARIATKTLEELAAVGFLKRDEADGWTWICDYLEHNAIPNSNVGKAVGKLLEQVSPAVAFYADLLEGVTVPYVDADLIETLSERYRNRIGTVVSGSKTHTQTQEHEHDLTHEHDCAQARETPKEDFNGSEGDETTHDGTMAVRPDGGGTGEEKDTGGNRRSRRSSDRGAKLPSDWQPTAEQLAYAVEQGCADPADTAERFRLHHLSKGTLGKDWHAGFQYWCRNEKNFKRAQPPQRNGFSAPTVMDDGGSLWGARMRGWQQSKFWKPYDWGPEPGEYGCLVPPALLEKPHDTH